MLVIWVATWAAPFAERFSDGEFNFQIEENVRGADVFIVQPTCPPTDAHLMELLVMLDAFRRSSAERITAVIPYYGYGRSDKKDRPRVPISAQAGREPDYRRRRGSHPDDGFARGADSGVL